MIKFTLDKKNAEVVATSVVNKDEFTKALEKNIDAAAKKVVVKGYRAGKAPREELLARVDSTKAVSKTIEEFASKRFQEVLKSFSEKENEEFAKVAFGQPVLDNDTDKEGNVILKFVFPALPDTSELSLEKVKVKYHLDKVTKEVVDAEVEKIEQSLGSTRELKKGEKTQLGDIVTINFKGFINDEAFEGGEASEYDLELGSKAFIPGFEDQLLDKAKGYKGDVTVTFPADYYVKEYQSKPAVFKVEILKAKRRESSKLDEKALKELLPHLNVKTIEELKELIKSNLSIHNWNQSQDVLLKSIVDQLTKESSLVINKALYQKRVAELSKNFTDSLKQFGVKKHEYLRVTKTTEEDLNKQLEEQALNETKESVVFNWLFSLSPQASEEDVKEFEEQIGNKEKMGKVDLNPIVPRYKLMKFILSVVDKKGLEAFEKATKSVFK
ncbi:trigger factor [Mycoplasmopsis gallinacea]|uniref:Trigger factor n=1 Tax=Mycoplasmopsis gallinacea TaxID=29556 RepID=A0A449A3H4_9BACT|nr:trigger factor [Mycoplasmopsis gallinacea]VEU58772.1 Trigger factor [Mycoplasmopsis gallinacea]